MTFQSKLWLTCCVFPPPPLRLSGLCFLFVLSVFLHVHMTQFMLCRPQFNSLSLSRSSLYTWIRSGAEHSFGRARSRQHTVPTSARSRSTAVCVSTGQGAFPAASGQVFQDASALPCHHMKWSTFLYPAVLRMQGRHKDMHFPIELHMDFKCAVH